MKKPHIRNNIAVLDIGKTHAKVILFDSHKLKELEVFQTENIILTDSLYPHFDIESLKEFIINSLSNLAKKYIVDSIFTSTHGACMALMTKGELALPYFENGKHFGSRIEILDDYLFVSIGERGKGMIAQDPSNSIGSIIRIHKNGEYPEDNPFLTNNEWLPELFQIGVRNPQGMTLDPQTNSIYISNHGPKGGDFIGKVVGGSNFGWKKIGWGGTNYSGTKIGDGNAWEPGFIKPDFIWVPSIAVSGIKFYQGEAFPEWQNSLLVSSLKFQYLSVLHRKGNKFVKEEVIFKDKIGRVRDIEIDQLGNIYIITDETDSNLFVLKP